MNEITPITLKELIAAIKADPNHGIYVFNTMEIDTSKNTETLDVSDFSQVMEQQLAKRYGQEGPRGPKNLKPYFRLPKLPVVYNIEVGEDSDREIIEVPATYVPIDLTEYAPANKILNAKGFMKGINSEAITLVSKETYETFFEGDLEAQEEAARIKKQRFGITGNSKKVLKKNAAITPEVPPVLDEIIKEKDLEKAIELFKSVSRRLKEAELLYLSSQALDPQLKQAVENRLNFFASRKTTNQ